MCVEAAARIIGSEELMEAVGIPPAHRDFVAGSFRAGEPALYGRFDLAYDGTGPAKLLEYNADTPTSLYEAASFQWIWLEDMRASGALPADADQFNGIHEAMVARFRTMLAPGSDLHFTSARGLDEDFATVEYMAWTAKEAGLVAHYVALEDIGLTTTGQFADAEDRVIGAIFKLYPWEDMLADPFSAHIPTAQCRMIEPAWKAVVSNKGILPVLWRMFEGHPNLLPAFFEDDFTRGDRDVEAGSPGRPTLLTGAGSSSRSSRARAPRWTSSPSDLTLGQAAGSLRTTAAMTRTRRSSRPTRRCRKWAACSRCSAPGWSATPASGLASGRTPPGSRRTSRASSRTSCATEYSK